MTTLLFSDKFIVLTLRTGAELGAGTLVVSESSSSSFVYDDGNQPLLQVERGGTKTLLWREQPTGKQ